MDPIEFRVGDIVEVQLNAAAVPIKRGRYKMVLQLRSVALVEGKFSQVSFLISPA